MSIEYDDDGNRVPGSFSVDELAAVYDSLCISMPEGFCRLEAVLAEKVGGADYIDEWIAEFGLEPVDEATEEEVMAHFGIQTP